MDIQNDGAVPSIGGDSANHREVPVFCQFEVPPAAQRALREVGRAALMAAAEMAPTTRGLAWLRRAYELEWSTRAFQIEFAGFRANHVLHGLGALGLLGASEAKMQAFADHYTNALCIAQPPGNDVGSAVEMEQANKLLGKRKEFEALRDLYMDEVRASSADEAIQKHLPRLAGGLAGALLHGVIQLGYAHRVGSDLAIAEGLAYMHYSFLTFEEPAAATAPTSGGKKPLTRQAVWGILQDLRSDQHLLRELHDRLDRSSNVRATLGPLQHRLIAFSSDPMRGDPLLFATVSAIVEEFDIVHASGHFALDFSAWLFCVIQQNDFVVLHAVTSAWAMSQVEHLLSPSDRRCAWKTWFRVVISAYIAHEAPALVDVDICDDAPRELPEWDGIVAKTLALPVTTDPHVFKLVQVAMEHATQRSPQDQTSAFLTPEERDRILKLAALKVLQEDFAIDVEG